MKGLEYLLKKYGLHLQDFKELYTGKLLTHHAFRRIENRKEWIDEKSYLRDQSQNSWYGEIGKEARITPKCLGQVTECLVISLGKSGVQQVYLRHGGS